ncbi:unnamed protein product [Symbiodinium sp. KB8]|nr:unnamed protein product [Symbiodinium sp. KB8]
MYWARLLHATERRGRVADGTPVEAHLGVVGLADHVVVIGEGDDRSDRAEDLVAGDLRPGGDVA